MITIHVANTKALISSASLFSHICKKLVFSQRGSIDHSLQTNKLQTFDCEKWHSFLTF